MDRRSHHKLICIIRYLISFGDLSTSDKVITARTSVSDHTSKLVASVEDNTVCARRTTAVGAARAQDGEFIIGAADREIETLVVVVDVGIGVRGRTRGVKLVTSRLGSAHSTAGVAVAAAGVGAGAGLEIGGNGDSSGTSQEEGGNGDDLYILYQYGMLRG